MDVSSGTSRVTDQCKSDISSVVALEPWSWSLGHWRLVQVQAGLGLETRDLGLRLGLELPSLGLCLSGLGLALEMSALGFGLEMSGFDNNTG